MNTQDLQKLSNGAFDRFIGGFDMNGVGPRVPSISHPHQERPPVSEKPYSVVKMDAKTDRVSGPTAEIVCHPREAETLANRLNAAHAAGAATAAAEVERLKEALHRMVYAHPPTTIHQSEVHNEARVALGYAVNTPMRDKDAERATLRTALTTANEDRAALAKRAEMLEAFCTRAYPQACAREGCAEGSRCVWCQENAEYAAYRAASDADAAPALERAKEGA